MIAPVVYIFRPTPYLVEWLDRADPDFLDCLRGPSVWLAKEGGQALHPPAVRLAKAKLLYFMWLLRSWDGLLSRLPPGSSVSLETFDRCWAAERVEADGGVDDLLSGVPGYALDRLEPTGDPVLDGWIDGIKRDVGAAAGHHTP